jgi:hypothetical protein
MEGKKVLIMGLPGAGKTTLCEALREAIQAVVWDADEVRDNLGNPGFSEEARLQQATRMGWLCDQVKRSGKVAVANFVCPLPATREAFGDYDLLVWMDTIQEGRFEDTNKLFVPPDRYDIRWNKWDPDNIEQAVEGCLIEILALL